MSVSTNPMDEVLGRRLRALREQKGLSLRALASQVDVTASFLSQLERGLCGPSLSTLRHLAAILEVPLFQLLADEGDGGPVVRVDERVTVEIPGSPATFELLSSGSAQSIEMVLIKLATPGMNLVRTLAVPTEECLHVLSGTMAIEFGGERHELHAGDSVTYTGRSLTSVTAVGEEELVMIAAITPPSF